ncbi:hypothetical protein GGX14DRAFT_622866 [Mycena pura]|uniref:Uncharacterized protein n=1 Tax=Mycena pura TaxID=153505 RepID=A0AAD6YCW9_9AGAR|nr:hypothetical protein GGX14DRAFT_622866 [Mycena pura]
MAGDLDLHNASFWSKLHPVPGLVVSTAATVLLVLQTKRDNTALYTFVTEHRTAIQVAIQIISHALGFIEIFTVTSIVNFSTRLRLSRGSVSLTELRLWQSVSSIRMVWSMPLLHLTILVPYIVFHLLPSALWAGAITPIASSTVAHGSIQVPVFGPDPHNEFWNHTITGQISDFLWPVTRNSKGVFSYTPAAVLQGVILNAAVTATSSGGLHMSTHPKNDNSRLTYVGRSFGVGSSAGLEDGYFDVLSSNTASSILGYSYQELGYSTNVQCIRNTSSGWQITPYSIALDGTFPNNYLAQGPLPNSQFNTSTMSFRIEDYATLRLRDDSEIVALVGLSHAPSNIFAIATGNGPYDVLDKVQCEAHFTPFTFDVFVDMTSLAITVTPLANSTIDMDPTSSQFGSQLGAIPQLIMREVTFLSMMNTNLYTSALGNAFMSSIANVAAMWNTSMNDTATIMEAISTSLESMIDDILVAYGSAQLEIGGAQLASMATETTTKQILPAMRIGSFQYVGAVNVLILGIYLAELLRTRGWRDMPVFDYNDIFSVVVAASRGGRELGDAVVEAHTFVGTLLSSSTRALAWSFAEYTVVLLTLASIIVLGVLFVYIFALEDEKMSRKEQTMLGAVYAGDIPDHFGGHPRARGHEICPALGSDVV